MAQYDNKGRESDIGLGVVWGRGGVVRHGTLYIMIIKYIRVFRLCDYWVCQSSL